MQVGVTAEKLKALGVQTLGIVAANAERAQLYFRFRPARVPVGADPKLSTHRAYGVPRSVMTPEFREHIGELYANLARELKLEAPAAEAYNAINRADGFTLSESDATERQRHQVQMTGCFLVDRDGIVRWAGIEDAQYSHGGLPADDEILAAARALSR